MKTTKHTGLTVLAMALLVTAAGPLVADYTYGCTLPMIPEPEELLERQWDARGLVMFLEENGIIEIKSAEQKTLAVRPEFAIVTPRSSRPAASGEGHVVKVEVGRQPLAQASDDMFPHVADALNETIHMGDFTVHSVRTMEHAEALRFPRGESVVALTLEYTNARPVDDEAVNSHKLVIFIKPSVPPR